MDVHALGGMLRQLDTIEDPRQHNVTYTLPQLLSCTLMAVLCRCDDYEEIAAWVALRHDWLVEVLGLPEDAEADYLLAIKKNQKSLYEDVKLFFDDAIEQNDTQVLTHTMEPDNGHGRLDERTVGVNVFTLRLSRRVKTFTPNQIVERNSPEGTPHLLSQKRGWPLN